MTHRVEIPRLQEVVARQLRRYESQAQAAAERKRSVAPAKKPWITLSREPGSGGHELGERLAERLGFELFDRSILDRMAESGPADRKSLRKLESGPHGALHEAVFLSLDHAWPGHHTYLKRLTATATELAARGGVIFLGRGIHFLLPPERGLRVRVIDPRAARVARVRASQGVGEDVASEWIARTDRNQHDLVQSILHRDLAETLAYDLVLVRSNLGLDACESAIVAALEAKCGFEVHSGVITP